MEEDNVIEDVDLAKNEEIKDKEEKEETQEYNKLNEMILSVTANIKAGETKQINSLTIEGVKEGMSQVKLGDAVVAFVNQDGKLEYTPFAEDPEIKKQLAEINKQLGENNKDKAQETTEKEEEKTPENSIKDSQEEPEEEEEKPEESEEMEKTDKEPQVDGNWVKAKGIEIRSDREIDEMRTFIGAIKKEHPELKEVNRAFIVPDKKDANSYHLVVEGKKGQYKEVPLEMTEGRNPMHEDVTTMDNDGNNTVQKKPIQMLKLNNRNMIMIYNGGRTTTSIHIGTRTDGDNYHSTEISRADSQNRLEDPNENVKKHVSSSRGNQVEGDNAERAYATIRNFEKQDVPKEIDPAKDQDKIEAEELEDFPTAIKDALNDSIKNALGDKGIHISNEAVDKMSKAIIDGKQFKDAVIEGMEIEEKAGRIPPNSAQKAGENICDSIENDEEYEQEPDPRAPGEHKR